MRTPVLVFALFLLLASQAQAATYYVDGSGGNDSNNGNQSNPWLTIQKAVKTVVAGDTIYARGGQYNGIKSGWVFNNSGAESQPITFTNYPGEQAVLRITNATSNEYPIFTCRGYYYGHPTWQTPKADYIRIIGTDVSPRTLSNGVESKKGIVIQGLPHEQSAGITARDCDHWEVAGVDFIEVSSGMFNFKDNWGQAEEHSTDHWHVHDNRVYNYYRESGMQFNGDENLIERNEIYKVSNDLDTPYGCQHINLLGDSNIVRGNTLSRLGSSASCSGILFEWDMSDNNTIERNLIYDVPSGISFQGGDNNIIRSNIIYMGGIPGPYSHGIGIFSYNNSEKTDWPCNELNPASSAQAIVPAEDPTHPDYQYFYNPRNCHSYGNQIYHNTIQGFAEGIRFYPLAGENTTIRNNAISGWIRGSICFYKSSDGTCKPIPENITIGNNSDSGNFGFKNESNRDFHLNSSSPLIDAGFNLEGLAPNDFDGVSRPQGPGWDIGAYEIICLHAETPPCNGCIETGELGTFIDRWKIDNLDVTIRELIEAISLWKAGCA